MVFATVLFVLGFLAVLVTPVYYLSVSKPWRNPIGRLMLIQQITFALLYGRSAYSLTLGTGHLQSDIGSLVFTTLIDAFLWAFIPVYEYTRRKSARSRLQRPEDDRGGA